MSNCGCNHNVNKFIDVSKLRPEEWDRYPFVLGLDSCGKVHVIDKPLFEMTEEDREKLDKIIIDGDGTGFLTDDGTYKEINFTTDNIILSYNLDPANFIINNQQKLSEIWDSCQRDEEVFVRMFIDPYNIPLNYAYGERSLILEYDRPIITISGTDVEYSRLKVLIAMNTDSYPFNLVYYDVKNFVDADGIVVTGGDGNMALYNDGTYKPTYTKIQVDALVSSLESAIESNAGNVAEIIETISSLSSRFDDLEADVSQNTTSIAGIISSTEEGFTLIEERISDINDQVSANTAGIETNRIDIENLRYDFTNDQKFKGYFENYNDMVAAVPNPTSGDYAWLASTGTVWSYNGTVWEDTAVPIPDQTVTPYDSTPQLNSGSGSAGISTMYSRGDHVHGSDPTKVNIEDLDDYLPLSGNSQGERMTGDIWMSTGNALRLTNSGNSNLLQDISDNTTKLTGNGVGGIDLIAANGEVKSNGEEIVTYDSNKDVIAKHDIILGNDNNLFGTDASGGRFNLIELSRWNIIDVGSGEKTLNLNSFFRPTVQMHDETGQEAHEIAYVQDVQSLNDSVSERIGEVEVSVATNTSNIETNRINIENLSDTLAGRELFRGYFQTTTEITSLSNPQEGNYAWNAETGTVWYYNGITWADTGDPIPDQTVNPSDSTPPVPYGDGSVGVSNLYMRADAVIPSDPSKASVGDLAELSGNLDGVYQEFRDYVLEHAGESSSLDARITQNTNSLSTLGNIVSSIDANVSDLQGRASSIEGNITTISENVATLSTDLSGYKQSNDAKTDAIGTNLFDIQGRVGSLENQGASLTQRVATSEQNILAHNTRISANETNITTLQGNITGTNANVSSLTSRVSTAEVNIATNRSDIDGILADLADAEHFRGYFLTNAEILALTGSSGDYAWSAESGTVWSYNGNTWLDTSDPIPESSGVTLSDDTPLMDGSASSGSSSAASRGDHRHPTDTSRASASDVSALTVRVSNNETSITGLRTDVDNNTSAVSSLETSFSTLQTNVTNIQGDISDLQSEVSGNSSDIGLILTQVADIDLSGINDSISDLQSAQATQSGNITTLQGNVSDLQTKNVSQDSIIEDNTTRISAVESISGENASLIVALIQRVEALEEALAEAQKHVSLTQAEYDAISVKDENTYYYIYE